MLLSLTSHTQAASSKVHEQSFTTNKMESFQVLKREIWSAEVRLENIVQWRGRDDHSDDGHSLIDAACILQLELTLAPRLASDHQNQLLHVSGENGGSLAFTTEWSYYPYIGSPPPQ